MQVLPAEGEQSVGAAPARCSGGRGCPGGPSALQVRLQQVAASTGTWCKRWVRGACRACGAHRRAAAGAAPVWVARALRVQLQQVLLPHARVPPQPWRARCQPRSAAAQGPGCRWRARPPGCSVGPPCCAHSALSRMGAQFLVWGCNVQHMSVPPLPWRARCQLRWVAAHGLLLVRPSARCRPFALGAGMAARWACRVAEATLHDTGARSQAIQVIPGTPRPAPGTQLWLARPQGLTQAAVAGASAAARPRCRPGRRPGRAPRAGRRAGPPSRSRAAPRCGTLPVQSAPSSDTRQKSSRSRSKWISQGLKCLGCTGAVTWVQQACGLAARGQGSPGTLPRAQPCGRTLPAPAARPPAPLRTGGARRRGCRRPRWGRPRAAQRLQRG